MTTPEEFFSLEARESLQRLAALVARPGVPPADDFVRDARALRGSALLAGRESIARVARGLEATGRSLGQEPAAWTPATRERVAQLIEDLTTLIAAPSGDSWHDEATVGRLLAEIEQLAGPIPVNPAASPSVRPPLSAGVRAFVAREGALIAGAIDAAARALRSDPNERQPLQSLLRRVQPLQGLDALSDLAPMPSLLEGLELAISVATDTELPVGNAADMLDTAALALSRASREIAETGSPDGDSMEARRFATRLLAQARAEPPIVPIHALFQSGDHSPVVERGTAPGGVTAESLSRVSLVSQGERLRELADRLQAASSVTQRNLVLATVLRALTSVGAAIPVRTAWEDDFWSAARETHARALPADEPGFDPSMLAQLLRDVGSAVAVAADGADLLVRDRLRGAIARAQPISTPEPTAQPEPEPEPVAIETLLATPEFAPEPELALVPILDLCYRGRNALERADQLRAELADALQQGPALADIRTLLDELLDLVPLALHES